MTDQKQITSRPGSLRSFLGRLVALIQVRAELFSLEAQEQKHAFVSSLLLAFSAFCLLLLGLISGLIFIVFVTPPPLRALVLGCMTLGLLLAACVTLWWLMRRMAKQPSPFSLTMTEVRKDLDALLGKD